jgi:hypothetical protein
VLLLIEAIIIVVIIIIYYIFLVLITMFIFINSILISIIIIYIYIILLTIFIIRYLLKHKYYISIMVMSIICVGLLSRKSIIYPILWSLSGDIIDLMDCQQLKYHYISFSNPY